ncbi:MAG: biotin/lipoyl-binding protein, partial [Alcanivoracaceae bacterium]|nr:biotin/lipoyl-binding protein [Alcanivoracaceae bacterium]
MSSATGVMRSTQLDFLPGALEVQDRPPSPTGRCIMWSLLTLFCIGISWAFLGEIDVVVSAPGRIVPGGSVKILQAPEAAVVASIHVRDGQHVDAGEALISLEATTAEADDARVIEQLENRARELAWRSGLEDWLAGSGHDVIYAEQAEIAGRAGTDR